MKLDFVSRVDSDLFFASAKKWREIIDENQENVNESHYAAILSYCEDVVSGETFGDGKGALCAVTDTASGEALGFIVVTAVRNRQLKMLALYVRPDLDAANSDPDVPKLAHIAARAIIGCLELTYKDYPCNVLKMQATWPLDHEFLTAFKTAGSFYDGLNSLFDVSSHANWIVLTKK